MGSGSALGALKRGEVHVAGIHLAEESSGVWRLPNLKYSLGDMDCMVVTFAHWEEGFIVRHDNPKKIRSIADIAGPTVKIVNREKGSGARRLLDKQLNSSAMNPKRIKGYDDEVLSHLDVASRIKSGVAGHRHRHPRCGGNLRFGFYTITASTIRFSHSEGLL
jgi:putative molybdopterin biosynthesis protein